MTRELPHPMSSTDMFMQVLIGQMDELIGLLHDGVRQQPEAKEGGHARLQEPAAPTSAQPVRVASANPEPEAEPDRQAEPEEPDALLEPPARAGRGSGLEAWQAFADAAGVEYSPADRRDDIVAACVAAKVIPAE